MVLVHSYESTKGKFQEGNMIKNRSDDLQVRLTSPTLKHMILFMNTTDLWFT